MLEFLRVLLFGTTVLLTPEPIDIVEGSLELNLDRSISALTSGAAMYIDVSSMVPDRVGTISEARAWVHETFDEGFATVDLWDASGKQGVTLRYSGSSLSNDSVYPSLSSRGGVPVGVSYDRLVLKTDADFYGVQLIWRNFKK